MKGFAGLLRWRADYDFETIQEGCRCRKCLISVRGVELILPTGRAMRDAGLAQREQ
jgi:hypothetical protein